MLAITKCDAALLGEVVELTPKPIQNTGGRCIWVTQLRLKPLEQLWGEFRAESITVLTLSLPADLQRTGPGGEGGCVFTSGDKPPPEVGSQGIFYLNGLAEGYRQGDRIAENATFLSTVKYGYVPVSARRTLAIFIDPLDSYYEWPLDVVLAAFKMAARRASIDSLKMASTIALVEVAPRPTQDGPGGESHLSMHVQQLYRGVQREALRTAVPSVPGNRNDPGEIMRTSLKRTSIMRMQKLRSKRFLFFGDPAGSEETNPAGMGWLAVSSQGTVTLPGAVVEEERILPRQIPLVNLEALIK